MELCGPVVLDTGDADLAGADKLSDNTGELSALVHAIQYFLGLSEAPQTVVFHYGSQYAV